MKKCVDRKFIWLNLWIREFSCNIACQIYCSQRVILIDVN